MTETAQTILEIVQKMLEYLAVDAEVAVEYDKEADVYKVDLTCDNPGVLIGYHGESLSALQLMVGQHLKVRLGNWVNVTINVNDYRQRRERILHQMANAAVEKVITSGQPHSLPPMPSGERRVVHLYLSKHDKVVSESSGEGRNRCVIVSLK